jgi:hypothetical protein
MTGLDLSVGEELSSAFEPCLNNLIHLSNLLLEEALAFPSLLYLIQVHKTFLSFATCACDNAAAGAMELVATWTSNGTQANINERSYSDGPINADEMCSL